MRRLLARRLACALASTIALAGCPDDDKQPTTYDIVGVETGQAYAVGTAWPVYFHERVGDSLYIPGSWRVDSDDPGVVAVTRLAGGSNSLTLAMTAVGPGATTLRFIKGDVTVETRDVRVEPATSVALVALHAGRAPGKDALSDVIVGVAGREATFGVDHRAADGSSLIGNRGVRVHDFSGVLAITLAGSAPDVLRVQANAPGEHRFDLSLGERRYQATYVAVAPEAVVQLELRPDHDESELAPMEQICIDLVARDDRGRRVHAAAATWSVERDRRTDVFLRDAEHYCYSYDPEAPAVVITAKDHASSPRITVHDAFYGRHGGCARLRVQGATSSAC